MLNYLLLFIGIILDLIVQSIYSIDFAYQSMFFVPCFSFMALLLSSKRFSLFEMIVSAFVLGLIQELFNGTFLFVYPLVYVLSVLLYTLWSKNLSDTLLETLILLVLMVFVKEIAVFCYYTIMGLSTMSFLTFLIKRCFLTILVGIGQGLIVIALDRLTQDRMESKKAHHNQNNDLFGRQFK